MLSFVEDVWTSPWFPCGHDGYDLLDGANQLQISGLYKSEHEKY